MDENWISLSVVTGEIARIFQVPRGIAQRRVIGAVNEGVRVRGVPRPSAWEWDSAAVRWPTHPNPDPRLPNYTSLSPDVFASATIDWEKGTLRHQNFSGEVLYIELEENDFRYWLEQANEATSPKADAAKIPIESRDAIPSDDLQHVAPDLSDPVALCIAWLRARGDNPGKRDLLRNSARTEIEGLTHREFDSAYRTVFKRKLGRPKET